MRIVWVGALAGGALLGPAAAQARGQTPDAQAIRQELDQIKRDFDALKQQYDERIAALEARLGAAPPAVPVQSPQAPATAPVPPGAEGGGGAAGTLPVYGSAVTGSKVFNPDIAVIGDFLGAIGKNPAMPDPFGPGIVPRVMQMHESEASFQAVVDPYARADFFISFGEEGVDLEEGYVTFTSLPGGLLTKVGKMRAAFGKVNTLHNHVLPWTDRPLVTNNLVGGEDGISDAGISVARLIPNPWLFIEATGQVFRGDSGPDERPLFRTSRRSDVSYVGHVRGYHDISDDTNIDFGFSYAHGHNDSGFVNGIDAEQFTTGLYGIDATYRWRPLQRSLYRSFVGRTEWIWSRRDQPNGLQRADGMYASGDYQFARRWFGGARYDRSYRADAASLLDTGGSLVLTYWPSEFSQLRGQYRHTNYALAPTANEFLFQVQFSIGAHGAHPF
jgi:hypothetical protein